LTAPIRIEDSTGSRNFEPGRFPLSLGGPSADVALPDCQAAEPLAWLGLSDGDIYVQTAEGAEPVVCNGTPISASHWLRGGDVVRVGTAWLRIESGPDGLRLRVEPIEEDNVTEPPLVVVEPVASGDELAGKSIRPVEFKPGGATRTPRRRRRFRPGAALLWVALIALGAVAWYVFSLRPVEVVVEPAPDRLEFQGGMFHWQLGGRWLLQPGSYTLVAEKEGYRRLDTAVEVVRGSSPSLHFTLQKLPGFLIIDAGGAEGATVRIDGELVGVTPLAELELAPGEYEVRIGAERYEEFGARVSIEGGGATETLQVELVPLWAEIGFRSRPSGATVQLDGEAAGVTPLTVDLLEGSHRVEYTLAGHKPHRDVLNVTANQPQSLPVVGLEQVDGKLVLRSEPSGASVTVDDVYRGQTPLELFLAPGPSHQVELSTTGHEPVTQDVVVRPGRKTELVLTLPPRQGEVRVVAQPADAQLYVDGEPVGEANRTLQLVAVPHRIEIRREGYEPHVATVTPRPGFPQELRVELKTAEQIEAESTPAVVYSPQGHKMVLIEGGRFRMGAARREPGRRSNETLRDVELTRKYYLSTTEVSNREFRQFMNRHFSGRIGAFNLEIDHHPAVRVTWEEAALYCNWLSEQESLEPAYEKDGDRVVAVNPLATGYRLPTEAEWAWAARYPDGQTALKYPWGNSLPVPQDAGNYADVSAEGMLSDALDAYDDHFPVTSPVDSFEPNALGLFNMGGNVAEWVHDVYAIRSTTGGVVEQDPLGPQEGDLHVIRGAGWMDSSVSELRLSYRDYGSKGRPDVGFRIARYAK